MVNGQEKSNLLLPINRSRTDTRNKIERHCFLKIKAEGILQKFLI